jgi:hypothetical protein
VPNWQQASQPSDGLTFLRRLAQPEMEIPTMNQEAAFEIASRYISDKGITHYGCRAVHTFADIDMWDLSFKVEPNFPEGIRRKVWCFYFALFKPEPNTVVSGGDYVVFIDDESGACGRTGTM